MFFCSKTQPGWPYNLSARPTFWVRQHHLITQMLQNRKEKLIQILPVILQGTSNFNPSNYKKKVRHVCQKNCVKLADVQPFCPIIPWINGQSVCFMRFIFAELGCGFMRDHQAAWFCPKANSWRQRKPMKKMNWWWNGRCRNKDLGVKASLCIWMCMWI